MVDADSLSDRPVGRPDAVVGQVVEDEIAVTRASRPRCV